MADGLDLYSAINTGDGLCERMDEECTGCVCHIVKARGGGLIF